MSNFVIKKKILFKCFWSLKIAEKKSMNIICFSEENYREIDEVYFRQYT